MTILAAIRRSIDILSYNIIISANTRNYFGCRKFIRFFITAGQVIILSDCNKLITLITKTIHTFIALVGSAIEL
jgi:hypothetical protein